MIFRPLEVPRKFRESRDHLYRTHYSNRDLGYANTGLDVQSKTNRNAYMHILLLDPHATWWELVFYPFGVLKYRRSIVTEISMDQMV